MVSLLRDDTPLGRQSMFVPGGEDLVAMVDASFLPLLQVDGMRIADREDLGRVRVAVIDALPQLLQHLVGGHAKIKCYTYAHLLQSMLTAIFPLPLFRDAYEAMLQHLGEPQTRVRYLELLQLVAAFGVEEVERPLRWFLSTDPSLPMSQLVSVLQKTPREVSSAVQIPNVPGGLRWLDVLFPEPTGVLPLHERALRPLPLLGDAPLFQDTFGQPVSLRDLVTELERNGCIRYRKDAKTSLQGLRNDKAVLAIQDSATQKLISSLFTPKQMRSETEMLHLLEPPKLAKMPDIDALFNDVLDEDDEPEQPHEDEVLDLEAEILNLPMAPMPSSPAKLIAPVLAPKVEPEEIIRQAIVAELEHAGQFDARLLSGINLARLVVGDAPDQLAVLCNAETTLINRRHPLMKRGIADPSAASRWRFFAVSAVYTALNEFLHEVTDVDEAVFLHWLSQRMAALD